MINALSLPFVGSHELRKDLTRLLDNVKKTNEPVVITSQGKPTAILTSVDNYNQLQEMINELENTSHEINKIRKELSRLEKILDEIAGTNGSNSFPSST